MNTIYSDVNSLQQTVKMFVFLVQKWCRNGAKMVQKSGIFGAKTVQTQYSFGAEYRSKRWKANSHQALY